MRKLFIAALLAAHLASAQTLPPESGRLVATAKLWIAVKYFHPYLAYRAIDWDKALIEALPKIRSAQSVAEYSTAIRLMLAPLQDDSDNNAPQRIWIHRGLPPSGAHPSSFYSAFQTASPQRLTLDMGGFEAVVRLSEPVASSPAFPSPPPDRAYPEPYPSTELRILAAFKIWGVIHHFFAYRDLMDEDWDDLLAPFLSKFIAAKNALEYNLAVSEMLTHLADSNVSATSATLSEYFGSAPAGLRLRLLEKHAVITEVLDPAATAAGIRVGDILKTVDGETLVDRFQREAPYIPASTPQSLGYKIMQRALNGADGSTALLTIEDRAGNRKQVSLKRSSGYSALLETERSGDVLKMLPGNVGYADLNRLPNQQLDSLFEKFHDAKAIVFDLRGASQQAAEGIAAGLTEDHAVPVAICTGPLTLQPDLPLNHAISQSASYFFVQTLDGQGRKFKGQTLLLIDERTANSAEYAALFFEVAGKAAFIGTPSAGAVGELTDFTVPGGIVVSFSGSDVRHANGGKLQRLGLQPAVSAAPTIPGIRAGKDEVLEKALEYITPKLPTRPLPASSLRSASRAGYTYPSSARTFTEEIAE